MELYEILAEIKLVKEKILGSTPGSIEHGELVVALYVLQDMAIKAYAVREAA
jgi:hypothetical protein